MELKKAEKREITSIIPLCKICGKELAYIKYSNPYEPGGTYYYEWSCPEHGVMKTTFNPWW